MSTTCFFAEICQYPMEFLRIIRIGHIRYLWSCWCGNLHCIRFFQICPFFFIFFYFFFVYLRDPYFYYRAPKSNPNGLLFCWRVVRDSPTDLLVRSQTLYPAELTMHTYWPTNAAAQIQLWSAALPTIVTNQAPKECRTTLFEKKIGKIKKIADISWLYIECVI